MRGLPGPGGNPAGIGRIIPARAGFTSGLMILTCVLPDHPRACGVYKKSIWYHGSEYGSSPRVRGLLGFRTGEWKYTGIIPARAGFTRPGGRVRVRNMDHPRACGVYRRVRRIVPRLRGSSPRVRGLRHRVAVDNLILGIIPARAGFTLALAALMAFVADHPRACGVYFGDHATSVTAEGSSPRVRGLQPPEW